MSSYADLAKVIVCRQPPCHPQAPLTPPASAQPPAPLPAWTGKDVGSITTHVPHMRTQAQRDRAKMGSPPQTQGKAGLLSTPSHTQISPQSSSQGPPCAGHIPHPTQHLLPLCTSDTMWVPLLLGGLCADLHHALSHGLLSLFSSNGHVPQGQRPCFLRSSGWCYSKPDGRNPRVSSATSFLLSVPVAQRSCVPRQDRTNAHFLLNHSLLLPAEEDG